MHRAWGAYPDTVITFPDAGLVLDLRRPFTPAIHRRLADLGLGKSFAIVTGCNPLGRILDEPENRRLTVLLASQVKSRYPGARPAEGASPDGTHREPGWALPVPLEEARKLAGAFLQNAIYWYDGERVAIVPIHAPGPVIALPAPPSG